VFPFDPKKKTHKLNFLKNKEKFLDFSLPEKNKEKFLDFSLPENFFFSKPKKKLAHV
jgi:hypothetical protein